MTPLTTSFWPAECDQPVLETTVGGVLRDQAALTPDAVALIECDMAGVLGRRWTYAELLDDSLRLAEASTPRPSPA
jgi:fatty-acyl-CoA synthase